jgi:hypothetical protein
MSKKVKAAERERDQQVMAMCWEEEKKEGRLCVEEER